MFYTIITVLIGAHLTHVHDIFSKLSFIIFKINILIADSFFTRSTIN